MTLTWPMTVAFSVAAVVLGALAYKGVIPPASLSALLGWLLPSPMKLGSPTATEAKS